jgi:hypothetical protein
MPISSFSASLKGLIKGTDETYASTLRLEGEFGRLNYLGEVIKRLLILSLIIAVNIGLCMLVRLEITPETRDKNASLTTMSAFLIVVPVEIRRLID